MSNRAPTEGERYTIFCSPEDQKALIAIRERLYPRKPWTSRSEIVRAALKFTVKALADSGIVG
jgi:hypothetical protein